MSAKANKVDLLKRQIRDAEMREGGDPRPPPRPHLADWKSGSD